MSADQRPKSGLVDGEVAPEALARWEEVQIKTFTRWVNMYVSQSNLELKDMRKDFEDGHLLAALVEQLSGSGVPRLQKQANMRIAKINNLGQVLNVLTNREHVKLVNTGAEDIIDGNIRIILGLIWTLIQRYQFTLNDLKDKKKQGFESTILSWVNEQVRGYPDVPSANNFSNSWQDGRLLCALADSMKPGCMQLDKLSGVAVTDVDKAMGVSEDLFCVPRLMDPQDLVENPEPHSVMTYVSYFWRYAQEIEQRLAAGGADPSKCSADGSGVSSGQLNQPQSFVISARDNKGQRINHGGETFKVVVAGEDGGSIIAPVADNGDGTYTVSFTPRTVGQHQINASLEVKLMGRPVLLPIAGAPFSCLVGEDEAEAKRKAAMEAEFAQMQALLAKYREQEAAQSNKANEIANAAVRRAEELLRAAQRWADMLMTTLGELNLNSTMEEALRLKEEALKAAYEAETAAKQARAAALEAEATGLAEQGKLANDFASQADQVAADARRRAAEAQALADQVLASHENLRAAQRHAELAHQASQSAAQDSASAVVTKSLAAAEQAFAGTNRHLAICEQEAEATDASAAKCLAVHQSEAKRWTEQAQRALEAARNSARTAQQSFEQRKAQHELATAELHKAELLAEGAQTAADLAQASATRATDPASTVAQSESEAMLARDHAHKARQQARATAEVADRCLELQVAEVSDLAALAREKALAAALAAENVALAAEAVAKSRAEADLAAARERDLIERKAPQRQPDGSFVMGDRLPVFTPNNNVNLGVLKCAVRYVSATQTLLVTVFEARNLEAQNKAKNHSDIYIKLYVLPDERKESKRKTQIRRKTVSPQYNERFEFSIPVAELGTRSLQLSVWHNKGFMNNLYLGQAEFDLRQVPVDTDETKAVIWLAIQPKPHGAHRRSGSMQEEGGTYRYPDGSYSTPDGFFVLKDGNRVAPWSPKDLPKGASLLSDGCLQLEDTTVRLPSGAICRADGLLRETDGSISQPLWKIPSELLPKDVAQREDYKFVVQDQVIVEQRLSNTGVKFGAVKLALSYHSASQRLHCGIYEARGLPRGYAGAAPTAFCQLLVLPDARYPDCRQKTNAIRKSVDPEWNQLISFDIAQENLSTHYLELSVLDQHNKQQPLGQLVIDLKSVQVDAEESQVTWWYALRPTSSRYEERKSSDIKEAKKAAELVESTRREQAEAQRLGQQQLNNLTHQIAAVDRNLLEAIRKLDEGRANPHATQQEIQELEVTAARLDRSKEDLLAEFEIQHRELERKERVARKKIRDQEMSVLEQRLASAQRRTQFAEADLAAQPKDPERAVFLQDCKEQEASVQKKLEGLREENARFEEEEARLEAKIQELAAQKAERDARAKDEHKLSRATTMNHISRSASHAQSLARQPEQEEDSDSEDEMAPMAAMPEAAE